MSIYGTRLASIQSRPAHEHTCQRCGIDYENRKGITLCIDCRPRKKDQ